MARTARPAATKAKKGAKGRQGSPGRYTPPQPKTKKHSPLWVPVAMFTLLVVGIVVIVANYLELLPGGKAQNSDLILGLVLIVASFAFSTQYR